MWLFFSEYQLFLGSEKRSETKGFDDFIFFFNPPSNCVGLSVKESEKKIRIAHHLTLDVYGKQLQIMIFMNNVPSSKTNRIIWRTKGDRVEKKRKKNRKRVFVNSGDSEKSENQRANLLAIEIKSCEFNSFLFSRALVIWRTPFFSFRDFAADYRNFYSSSLRSPLFFQSFRFSCFHRPKWNFIRLSKSCNFFYASKPDKKLSFAKNREQVDEKKCWSTRQMNERSHHSSKSAQGLTFCIRFMHN